MPDAQQSAVFLSYARDDTPAAQRLAEALRASGIEVWFDQNELVGGDAWDQKIRRQIAECRLFIPLISATTQARREGYFRLEWRLADERTHLMAEGTPFLLPVVIDETRERDALAPKSFVQVQWTRLSGGEASEAFVARVKKLLEGGGAGAPGFAAIAPPPARGKAVNRRWPWLAVGFGMVVVGLFGYLALRPKSAEAPVGVATVRPAAEAAAPRNVLSPRSLAVLPFENLSTEPDSAIFADGIHGEVLTAVGKISALTVIGRTSVLPYAEVKKRNLRQIGADLGVGTVVEGRVQRDGHKVRVTVELVDTQTGRQLSSNVYERELTGIFAIQAAIAEEVATTLKASLTTDERTLIGRQLTKNPLAYELYLRARVQEEVLTSRSSLEQYERTLATYQRAVEEDPGFAIAHAKLAVLHSRIFWFGYMDPTPARRAKAEAAMQVAMRLDPDAPETHVAQAAFAYFCENDWLRSLAGFQLAAASLPNDALLQGLIGYAHRRLGNWQEAIRSLERAIALSPHNLYDGSELALFLHYMGRHEAAKQLAGRYAAQFPNEHVPQDTMIRAEFALRGDREAFRKSLEGLVPAERDAGGRQAAYERATWNHDFAAAERVLAGPDLAGISDLPGIITEPVALHRALVAFIRGNRIEARQWAQQAIDEFQKRKWSFRQEPYVALGVARAKAFAGRTEEAVLDAQAAVALAIKRDVYGGAFAREEAGRTFAAIGRRDESLAALQQVLQGPCRLSPNEIRLDPLWSRLKEDPRLETILSSVRPR